MTRITCRTCGAPAVERFEGRSGTRRLNQTVYAHAPGHAPADGHPVDPTWAETGDAPVVMSYDDDRNRLDLIAPGRVVLATARRHTRKGGAENPGWYITRVGDNAPVAGPIRLKSDVYGALSGLEITAAAVADDAAETD